MPTLATKKVILAGDGLLPGGGAMPCVLNCAVGWFCCASSRHAARTKIDFFATTKSGHFKQQLFGLGLDPQHSGRRGEVEVTVCADLAIGYALVGTDKADPLASRREHR